MVSFNATFTCTQLRALCCWAFLAWGVEAQSRASMQAGAQPADEGFARIHLQVGETHQLHLPTAEEVKISRKGVIALQWVGPGQARMVALKPGFVLLSAVSREATLGKTYAVEVVSVPKKPSAMRGAAGEIPEWLCQQRGLSCHQASRLVRGVNDDFYHHLRAKAYCLQETRCAYEGILSEQAQQGLQAHWQHALGDPWQVQVNALGVGLVLLSCRGDEGKRLASYRSLLDKLSGGLLSRGLLSLSCREDYEIKRFIVEGRVVLINAGLANQAGFDAGLSAEAMLMGPVASAPKHATAALTGEHAMARATAGFGFYSRLKSLLAQNKAQILGHPTLRTIGGKKSFAKSGGEFLILREGPTWGQASTKNELWKDYGVALAATVYPLANNQVLFDYDLSLKQPSRGGRHLETSHLRAQLVAPLAQEFIAGSITLRSASDQATTLPVLAQLPLIGPLFKALAHEEASAQVYLWITLKEDSEDTSLVAQ